MYANLTFGQKVVLGYQKNKIFNPQLLISANEELTITVGNWNLSCKKDGELSIINSDGQQQATILKEDLPGFLFESNRGTKHTFTAETSLGPELAAGWTSKKTKRLRSKAEAVKQKVKSLAKDIYDNHFKVAQSQPRGVVAKLKTIVDEMNKAGQGQILGQEPWKEILLAALQSLGMVYVFLKVKNVNYDNSCWQNCVFEIHHLHKVWSGNLDFIE